MCFIHCFGLPVAGAFSVTFSSFPVPMMSQGSGSGVSELAGTVSARARSSRLTESDLDSGGFCTTRSVAAGRVGLWERYEKQRLYTVMRIARILPRRR